MQVSYAAPLFIHTGMVFASHITHETLNQGLNQSEKIITASSSEELLHNNLSLSWGLADNQIQYFALDLYLISDLSVQNKLILIPSFNVYKAIAISFWQWLRSE